MRADIRIRIRGGVIRIRISEARFRAVIRITAEMDTTEATNLDFPVNYSLQPEAVSISPHRHATGKLVTLLYLAQNIQDIL